MNIAAHRALIANPVNWMAILGIVRTERAEGDQLKSGRWLARAAIGADGTAEYRLSRFMQAYRFEPYLIGKALEGLRGAFQEPDLFLFRQLASQSNLASVGRMICEAIARRSPGLAAVVRADLASIGVRSRTIDYVSVKSAIGTNKDAAVTGAMDAIGREIASALPVLEEGAVLPDLEPPALDAIAHQYSALRDAALNGATRAWSQDDLAPERARTSISGEWLKGVFNRELGPSLGIMQGEWRSRSIDDLGAGDVFFDLAYERTQDDGFVQFDKNKTDRIRLYALYIVAQLVEREQVNGQGALNDLARLLRRTDEIDDPRTLLFTRPGGPVHSTTRDIINAERSLWLKSRLCGQVHRPVALEIGAGYGHLISHLLRMGMIRKGIIIDRPLNLVVAKRFLEVVFPGRVELWPFETVSDPLVTLVPPWLALEIEESVDVALNFISFAHMTEDVLTYYDKALARLSPKYLVMENAEPDRICRSLGSTISNKNLVERERETRTIRPVKIERSFFA